MTVFSGVSLPGVTGAHAAEKCFLTGTPHPERGGFRNWVSLDQFAAEQIGNQTRYPSLVLAMTNENFKNIITKPDNVPIVMLIFSVGFTTWLALRLAVINDARLATGQPPLEKLEDEKVLVWPDLVYTELIAMVVCTLVLVVWAVPSRFCFALHVASA